MKKKIKTINVAVDFDKIDKLIYKEFQKLYDASEKFFKHLKKNGVDLDVDNQDCFDPQILSAERVLENKVDEFFKGPNGYYRQEQALNQLQKNEYAKLVEMKKDKENKIRALSKYKTEEDPEMENVMTKNPNWISLIALGACFIDSYLNFIALDPILGDKLLLALLSTIFIAMMCDVLLPDLVAHYVLKFDKNSKKDVTILIVVIVLNYIPLILLAIIRLRTVVGQTVVIAGVTMEQEVSQGQMITVLLCAIIPILSSIVITLSKVAWKYEHHQAFYAEKKMRKLITEVQMIDEKVAAICESSFQYGYVEIAEEIARQRIRVGFDVIRLIISNSFSEVFGKDANDITIMTRKQKEMLLVNAIHTGKKWGNGYEENV